MNALEKAIAQASQKYYTDGTSDVSDAQFDKMLDELKATTPDSPLLTQVGHGYQVELDTTPGQKVEHRYGLVGSLDKCHNYAELDNRLKNKDLWASLKLDGLSIVLYFRHGHLYQALTRGKNDIGIDITPKAVKMLKKSDIPDKRFNGAVRGEILMSHENFIRFQALHPEAENARNSAAGLINASEVSDELEFLNIVVYSVVGVEDNKVCYTYGSMREWLIENFEHVAYGCELNRAELSESALEETMFKLQSDWYGTYPADGIVLSENTLMMSPGKVGGYVVVCNASAFKFPAEQTESEVVGVEWTLSKTKYMIPVAQLSPVRLAGTTVKAATGISAEYIRDNSIGAGAQVIVEKANEIIPKIIKVTTPGEISLPTHCPACNSELQWSGVHLQCKNDDCAGGELQDTLIWLNVISPCERLGDKLKTKFLTELFGSNISIEKIYESEIHEVFVNDSSTQKQLFADMYRKLFTGLIKLCDAIRALNIPRFGDVNSRTLAEYPDDVKKMLEAAVSGEYHVYDLSSKIGEANFKALDDNLRKLKRLAYVKDRIVWEPEVTEKGKVAITGKLSVSRAVFETELRNAGYAPGSISKDTKFLITDNPFSTSSKNKFADDHGIQKITESEFRKQFM